MRPSGSRSCLWQHLTYTTPLASCQRLLMRTSKTHAPQKVSSRPSRRDGSGRRRQPTRTAWTRPATARARRRAASGPGATPCARCPCHRLSRQWRRQWGASGPPTWARPARTPRWCGPRCPRAWGPCPRGPSRGDACRPPRAPRHRAASGTRTTPSPSRTAPAGAFGCRGASLRREKPCHQTHLLYRSSLRRKRGNFKRTRERVREKVPKTARKRTMRLPRHPNHQRRHGRLTAQTPRSKEAASGPLTGAPSKKRSWCTRSTWPP